MKMGFHTYINGKLKIKLEPENETERSTIEFFIGKAGAIKKFEGEGDAHNGLFIDTGKTLK